MVLAFILSSAFATQAALEFSVLDESGRPAPCRIHLRDASEKPVKAPELPFWSDHFVCTGKVSLALDPGKYTYEIERGPEFERYSEAITITEGAEKKIQAVLNRLVDMPKEGWWPGELHVHRPMADIET